MNLVLTNVGSSTRDTLETRPDPIGIILLDAFGNWEVARRDGHVLSGSGPVMGLKRNGTWVNNLEFDDSRSVFNSDEQKLIVRGAKWFLYSLNEILEEWGYTNLSIKKSASFLSSVSGRVFDITDAILTARKIKMPEKKLREICRSASLATGLMTLMETSIKKTIPVDDQMRDHFEKTYQNGISYRNEHLSDSEIRLDFRFPRLSYCLKLASVRVPMVAEWQKANRPEELSQEDFLREVSNIGRPAIFRALFDYDREKHPKWLGDVIGQKDGTGRSRYLFEEIVGTPEMDKHIESALISKGGDTETVVHGLLRDLVEGFGGVNSAALSWSVGLVAENIVAAPHRAGRSAQAATSSEQVWLAAQDRMMMAPLMRALTEAGCLVSSARCGRVTVTAPRVPEVLLAAVSLAWDHGAYLPLGQAAEISKTFSTDLPTERSAFLGSDADYLVAAANHKGDKKTLWGLDAICDLKTPKERADRAASVLW